jgi:hypothetical protein
MAARGYGTGRRWALVAVLVAVLVALPLVLRVLPAADSATSAARLRAAVLASDRVQFSGFAQSAGGLSLPVTDQLTSLADLFSQRTTMRVWWRGAEDNRVDVVTPSGETGIHTTATGTWSWDYEGNRATVADPSPLTEPAPPDLLPSTLGRRLLSEAADREVSRIGAARVAGRDALGLRLIPSAPASSVERVDVWVDRASGLPLQVRVFAKGARLPALDTHFLDLDLRAPAAEVTAFQPPAGASVSHNRDADLLEQAGRQVSRVQLPETLAGLPRRTIAGAPRGVGVYGQGVTLLVVVPLSDRLAGPLRRVAATSPDAVRDQQGLRLAAGPVALMLVDAPFTHTYLLTGTVTVDAVAAAASQLRLGENG